MKYFIILIIFVLGGGYFLMARNRQPSLPSVSIYFNEMPKFFKALKNANQFESFLILSLADTEKYIQFKYVEEKYEIDFPIVTDKQKKDEKRIRTVCKSIGLVPVVNKSSDPADYFLDIYLDTDENSISETVKKLFQQIYSAKENSVLIASYNNLKI